MKKLSFLLIAVAIFSTTFAQTAFRSGSAQLDIDLNRINTSAKRDYGKFRTDIRLTYRTSDKKINYMRNTVKMQPADIYFAFEISRISRRPIDNVISVYRKHKSKGWGYMAKQMGIKPGSAQFHALKGNASGKAHKNKGNKGNNGNGKGNSKNKGKGKKK